MAQYSNLKGGIIVSLFVVLSLVSLAVFILQPPTKRPPTFPPLDGPQAFCQRSQTRVLGIRFRKVSSNHKPDQQVGYNTGQSMQVFLISITYCFPNIIIFYNIIFNKLISFYIKITSFTWFYLLAT